MIQQEDAMKNVMIAEWADGKYRNISGDQIKREYGNAPNGVPFCGKWVYRMVDGTYVDHDAFRNDLAERHNIVLIHPDTDGVVIDV
jgi:hypothetical protein